MRGLGAAIISLGALAAVVVAADRALPPDLSRLAAVFCRALPPSRESCATGTVGSLR